MRDSLSTTQSGYLKLFVVKFLTRPGCLLCEEALPLVRGEVRRAGYELQVVDIESDDDLLAEYGLRIPVLLGPDGAVVAEGPIGDRRRLRRAIRRSGVRGWLRRPRRR